ncbi:MAG: helix-turn-helix transcriptional regulator [Bacteroidales bacterium]
MLQGFLFHFEKPFCRNCLFLGFQFNRSNGNDTEPTIQERLFREIKLKVKEDNSFVHTIAELLHVSYDSAYRRIRGEKIISVDELYKLSKAFDISIDSLFEVKSGKTVFNSVSIEPGKITLKQWLEGILLNLQVLQADQTSQIIYAAKDAPFFHYFHIPELAAFKMFFWEKPVQVSGFENKPFNLADTDDELQTIGKKFCLPIPKSM